MSTADVFAVEDDSTKSVPIITTESTQSPSIFLNGLNNPVKEPPVMPQQQYSTQTENGSQAPSSFNPNPSPTFLLSSLTQDSSREQEDILRTMKQKLESIKPWKDFFALEQFHIPESPTAAQSKISHNTSYYQSNYLVIFGIIIGFSLLSNFTLIIVAAVILGGFYYISKLPADFRRVVGSQEITLKHLHYGWIVFSLLLIYFTTAFSVVLWILSVSGVLIIGHAALHDIAIENEFNSV